MLKKFASEIEEIAHLALGPNATPEQVNQDLLAIAERMLQANGGDAPACDNCVWSAHVCRNPDNLPCINYERRNS